MLFVLYCSEIYTDVVLIWTVNILAAVFCFVSVCMLHLGRIVNVSSVKGLFVVPFTAAYSMTKYAVEAFSDSLRLEMNKFGVAVSIVEPGHFGSATESINVCLHLIV